VPSGNAAAVGFVTPTVRACPEADVPPLQLMDETLLLIVRNEFQGELVVPRGPRFGTGSDAIRGQWAQKACPRPRLCSVKAVQIRAINHLKHKAKSGTIANYGRTPVPKEKEA